MVDPGRHFPVPLILDCGDAVHEAAYSAAVDSIVFKLREPQMPPFRRDSNCAGEKTAGSGAVFGSARSLLGQ